MLDVPNFAINNFHVIIQENKTSFSALVIAPVQFLFSFPTFCTRRSG